MPHSNTHCDKSMRKSKSSKTVKTRRLDETGSKSYHHHGKKERDRSPSVDNSTSNGMNQYDHCSGSLEHLCAHASSDDSFLLYGLQEIVPSRYLPSATEISSSDEERNILALPVQVDVEKRDEMSRKFITKDGSSIRRPFNERSYFIKKENYIISNQVRIPEDIIKEGRSQMPQIPSGTEIIENAKTMRTATVLMLLVLLFSPLVAGIWLYVVKPAVFTSTKRKVSLMRCFLEYVYDAVLDIYQ